jgi:hypothetical protein
MDELLLQVLAETKRLCESEPSDDYEQFVNLVELRQQLTDRIEEQEEGLQPNQKLQMQQLLTYDSVIMREMQRLKDEAMDMIGRMNSSKKQYTAYNNKRTYDSFMFDKRK